MKNETSNTAQDSFSPKTVRKGPNRRDRRAALQNQNTKRNDGKYKESGNRQMMQVWNDQAIFIPRRHKLKGYEKEARRNNHHRKAA